MPLISPSFLLFLAISLALYYLTPKGKRWLTLSLCSMFFYLFAGIIAFGFLLIILLSSYFFALMAEKGEGKFISRCYMGSLVVLTFWLSARLFAQFGSIILPLGISFYSLRVISYLVDIGRKRAKAQKNIFKYMLFIAYFPMVIQGPLAQYSSISDDLYGGRVPKTEEFLSGVIRALWGIFKKVVVASALALPLSEIYENPQKYSGAYTLLLLIGYSAEIYCDFSGGIDISLGVSRLFGIKLPENFDRPFASRSLREFWNRWHITLGEFFEHYVFYPLSLSRPMQRLSRWGRRRFGAKVGRRLPLYIATMLTWLCTGLWHGARVNFLLWGIINGVLVLMSQSAAVCGKKNIGERKSPKFVVVLRIFGDRIRVFFIIGAVRLLDVYKSPILTFKKLGSVFYDIASYKELFRGGIFELMSLPQILVVAVSLILLFAVSEASIKSETVAKKPFLSAFCVFSLLTACLLFGSYGYGFDLNDFIYSRY